jgi:cAMP phosphodiesterase
MILDGVVAFDAGSLAIACDDGHRANVRDVVVTHAHLDHIAGLPLFIDDLFASLREPVRIHASRTVIRALEEHIFNWVIYPRFSELNNQFGPVVEYVEFEPGREFSVRHLSVRPIEVNHKVPTCGFIISDGMTTIATTGDTAATSEFWETVNRLDKVDAVFVECAFPNDLRELAAISHHLTPDGLAGEMKKLQRNDCRTYVVNLKPAYRDRIVSELCAVEGFDFEVLSPGVVYEW